VEDKTATIHTDALQGASDNFTYFRNQGKGHPWGQEGRQLGNIKFFKLQTRKWGRTKRKNRKIHRTERKSWKRRQKDDDGRDCGRRRKPGGDKADPRSTAENMAKRNKEQSGRSSRVRKKRGGDHNNGKDKTHF